MAKRDVFNDSILYCVPVFASFVVGPRDFVYDEYRYFIFNIIFFGVELLPLRLH